VLYLDPAQRLRILSINPEGEETSNLHLVFDDLLPPNTTLEGQPKLFDTFQNILAVSYPQDSTIVVMNLASNELIKVVYVNPNFFMEVATELLRVGKIQDSEPG